MMKACVIGWPISHSRSPLIHNHWLKTYGIDGTYERVAVEPGGLPGFVASLRQSGYRGCNVTIPHKEAVFGLVTVADDATGRLGVVNTIYIRDEAIYGTSTDGEGFLKNLRASAGNLVLRDERTVILGAGGAAMAIMGALLDEGVREIAVANRTPERSERLKVKFGRRVRPIDWRHRSPALSECALLVNTTSLGMAGQPPLELDLTPLSSRAVVADIVYTPLATRLLQAARERGNAVAGGLGMLLYQAVRGFELWFGVRPAVTRELHDLVAADIDPTYRP